MTDARTILAEAQSAAATNDTARASDLFSQLIDRGELVWEALGHRAWMLKSFGNYHDALADYRQMAELQPADTMVRSLAAECLLLMGRPEDCIREAATVLQNDPANSAAAAALLKARERLHPVANPLELQSGNMPISRTSPNAVTHALETDTKTFPTSCFPEVGHLIYSMIRALRPRVAIETGAYIGYSATCTAQAMEDNGFGELHSFDIFEHIEDYTSPVLGPHSDRLAVATGHVEKAGLSHRVTFYKGDSSTNIRKHLVDQKVRADFAFIDGDHSIKGALKDWYAVDECLNEGGIIMLHDTVPEKCHWLGPRYLLEAIASKGGGGATSS